LPPEVFYTHLLPPSPTLLRSASSKAIAQFLGVDGLKIWQRFTFASQQQEASLNRFWRAVAVPGCGS